MAKARHDRESTSTDERNEVTLRGRMSGEAQERVLPSGDLLLTFRITVGRSGDPRGSRVTVDTIDCVVRRAGLRRSVGAWRTGDRIEVEGMLRRRFWRGASGLASRYEVEVVAARRSARAA